MSKTLNIDFPGEGMIHPRDRVLAIEAVVKSICVMAGADPAEGIMMLLTAAAHLQAQHSDGSEEQNTYVLAHCLGHAMAASDGFFPPPLKAANDTGEETLQ